MRSYEQVSNLIRNLPLYPAELRGLGPDGRMPEALFLPYLVAGQHPFPLIGLPGGITSGCCPSYKHSSGLRAAGQAAGALAAGWSEPRAG